MYFYFICGGNVLWIVNGEIKLFFVLSGKFLFNDFFLGKLDGDNLGIICKMVKIFCRDFCFNYVD